MPRGRKKRQCRSSLPPRNTTPLIGAAVVPALMCSAGQISMPALHLWLVIAAHAWQEPCDLTNAALSRYLPEATSERRVSQLLSELARAGLLSSDSRGSERRLQPLVPDLAGNPIAGKFNFNEIPHEEEESLQIASVREELPPHPGGAGGNFPESQFPGNGAAAKLTAFLIACGVFPQTVARHLAELLRSHTPDEIAWRTLAHQWQLAQEGFGEAQRGGLLVYRLVENELSPPAGAMAAAQDVLPSLDGWEARDGDGRDGVQALLQRMDHARYATGSVMAPPPAFEACAPLVSAYNATGASALWSSLKQALAGSMAQETFRLHFAGAQPLGFVPDDAAVMARVGLPAGTLVVQAASDSSLDWIRHRLHKIVARAAAQVGMEAPVHFVPVPFAADMPPQFTEPELARRVWQATGLAGAVPLGFNGDGTTLVLYASGALDLDAVNAALPAPYHARRLNLAAGETR